MPINAKCLITTNKEINMLTNKSSMIEIEPFDKDEAKEFIRKSIGENIEENEIELLFGLISEYFKTELRPYVLNKLITIIKLEIENIFFSFETFLKKCKNNRNEMINDLIKEDKLFELLNDYH